MVFIYIWFDGSKRITLPTLFIFSITLTHEHESFSNRGFHELVSISLFNSPFPLNSNITNPNFPLHYHNLSFALSNSLHLCQGRDDDSLHAGGQRICSVGGIQWYVDQREHHRQTNSRENPRKQWYECFVFARSVYFSR